MSIRLVKVAKELNKGTGSIVDFLSDKGFEIDNKPTAKVSDEMYNLLIEEFGRAENCISGKKPKVQSQKKEAMKKNPGTSPAKTVKDKSKISSDQENRNIWKDIVPKRTSEKKASPVQKESSVGKVIFKTSKNAKEETVFDYLNDIQISLARGKIVGRSIKEVARLFKISPQKIIEKIQSSRNVIDQANQITETIWQNNVEYFLVYSFYDFISHERIRRKIIEKREVKVRSLKKIKNTTQANHPESVIDRRKKKLAPKSRRSRKYQQKRKNEIKVRIRGSNLGSNKYGYPARIISIGHYKY